MRLRIIKTATLAVLMVGFVGLKSDSLLLNPAQQVALPHSFSLIRWEAGNLLSKWVHRLTSIAPWTGPDGLSRRSLVWEYFRLGEEIRSVHSELEKATAVTGHASGSPSPSLQAALARLSASRGRLRDDVEEVLEATISSVLGREGIASWGEIVFPPVDVRLGEPPKLLVTSPRDRILRLHDALLDPEVNAHQSETMERALMDEWDLSGLVTEIGGVATIPASISSDRGLRETLALAAHEWVHQYLAAHFRSLIRNSNASPEMQTLHETFSDVAGGEIGDIAYRLLGGDDVPRPHGRAQEAAKANTPREVGEFSFDVEMRATRLRVDQLLASGSVGEAEAYMEERRQHFVGHGHYIRKINQAYFALKGTYAESAESTSPIAGELHEFRSLSPDLKTFMATVSKMASYPSFQDALGRLKTESGR